jgi:hypothetical protein
VRRIVAAVAAVALVLGFSVIAGAPASATITSPANGSVLRDVVTLSSSGGFDDSTLDHCSWFGGSGGDTRIQLINSGGAVVFEQFWNTGGSRSVDVDTRSHVNGSYTVKDILTVRKNSGFGGFGCKNETRTHQVSVSIDNFVTLSYSGATTAPRNTSIPVSSTVVDGDSGNPVAGLTVQFSLSGGGSVSATTNGSGVASASLPVQGSPRTATLTIGTSGNAYWRGGSITRSFAVQKNSTATTIAPTSPVVHGQPVSFSAQVAATNGSGTPSGQVQFTVDGVDFGAPVTLVAGAATTPPSTSLSTGSHTVGASYGGDSGFLASSAPSLTQVVGKAATTTALEAAPSPTVSGQVVTFTATVDVVAPGAGEPTGSVQFNVDGDPYGTAVPLGGGAASLTVSDLTTGNHDVEAVYNGDPDFATSGSATITHGVNKADSDLELSTSDATAVSGQPLTFTAEVTAVGPGSGTPTGAVQFFVDGDPLGDPVALSGGSASSPTAHLTTGSHAVSANYAGDANFAGAHADLTQAVAQAASTTSVAAAPNPSVFGQPVALSATVAPVAPGAGTPSGTVQFVIDGVPSGPPVALVDGETAPYSVSTLSRASHTITAVYAGDAEFTGSESDELTQVVNRAATKVVVESSSPTSVHGQPVTLTASVSVVAPGAGAPSGTITFTDGTTVLDTVPVDSSTGEQASITTSSLSVGQHAISATYSGDDSFLTSSGSTTQKVQRAQTSTVVLSSANPAQTGQGVKFTAQVTPVAPGAGNPTGSVVFTVNGAQLGSAVPVDNGSATSSSFATLSPGTYTIRATYSGDGNFVGSSGLLDQGAGQSVAKGATSTVLTSGPDPAVYGEPVTFTATVSAVAPATGRPSGVVRFWEGSVLLGSASLAPAGSNAADATFVSSTLSPGAHTVRAEYVGNFNFDGSGASTEQTIAQIGTVTGLESSANPSTFGEPVTLTAVVTPPAGSTGSPTGSVVFTEGATVLGSATVSTVDGRRQASLTVSGLGTGSHTVRAAYSGDAVFAASTSADFVQQVGRAASTIVAGAPDVPGSITATLTGVGGAPLPGETVSFYSHPSDNHRDHLCDAVTDAAGVASCDIWVINIVLGGSFDGGYDAAFAGNADYLPDEDYARQF